MTDEPVQPTNAAPKSRTSLVVVIAAVVVLALAGAGIYLATSSSGITVTGELQLSHRENLDGHCDTGLPGSEDIHAGAQIVVTDGGGKTLAIGRLGSGTAIKKSLCLYEFTIDDVPGDEDFYAIEVAHRDAVQFSRADLDKTIRLSIG
jgi:hypothetical protein